MYNTGFIMIGTCLVGKILRFSSLRVFSDGITDLVWRGEGGGQK